MWHKGEEVAKPKFPAVIFVRKEKEEGGDEYLLAFDTIDEAVEEYGVTEFARYDLRDTSKGTKVVVFQDKK